MYVSLRADILLHKLIVKYSHGRQSPIKVYELSEVFGYQQTFPRENDVPVTILHDEFHTWNNIITPNNLVCLPPGIWFLIGILTFTPFVHLIRPIQLYNILSRV